MECSLEHSLQKTTINFEFLTSDFSTDEIASTFVRNNPASIT